MIGFRTGLGILMIGLMVAWGCSDETAVGSEVDGSWQTTEGQDGGGNGGGADVGTYEDASSTEDGGPVADVGEPNDVGQPQADVAAPEEDGGQPLPDVEADTGNPAIGAPYVSTADPYGPGDLSVERITLASGAPVPLLIFVPEGDGPYPVVVFQHGFILTNSYYSTLLEHVASHGFVVVAPQMYTPGRLFGNPSTGEEADTAEELYGWVETSLAGQVAPEIRTDLLGLAGHSRGARVIWWTLKDTGRVVQAVAGVDPVDGTGGPGGNEPRVVASAVDLGAPVLVIGTGLGSVSGGFFSPACAPAEDNYTKFYAASPAPAWSVLAPEYGHLDMLNDTTPNCGLTCSACVDGPSRAPFRNLSAGMLTAFFRGALSGDAGSYATLSDGDAAPITVVLESR